MAKKPLTTLNQRDLHFLNRISLTIQYQFDSIPVCWFTPLSDCPSVNCYPRNTSHFSLFTELYGFSVTIKMGNYSVNLNTSFKDVLINIGLGKKAFTVKSVRILQTLPTFVIMISRKKGFCPKKNNT